MPERYTVEHIRVPTHDGRWWVVVDHATLSPDGDPLIVEDFGGDETTARNFAAKLNEKDESMQQEEQAARARLEERFFITPWHNDAGHIVAWLVCDANDTNANFMYQEPTREAAEATRQKCIESELRWLNRRAAAAAQEQSVRYEVAIYETTPAFRAIAAHTAVRRAGTHELIAVTGPVGDAEASQHATLLADALNASHPLDDILAEVAAELQRAQAQHAPISSAHEGYAVLLEEVEEVWALVKQRQPDRAALRAELLQVAAMAVRMIVDVVDAEDSA